MAEIKAGQRVRLTADMTNPRSTWMPREEGMVAGLEGTITYVSLDGPPELHQLGVKWDNGRTLSLLPHVDRFEVFEPKEAPA